MYVKLTRLDLQVRKRAGLVYLYFYADFFFSTVKQIPSFLNSGKKPICWIIFLSKCLKMLNLIWQVVNHYLKGVAILSLVDGSQDGLVDPEAHGGGDQSQGEVANHTGNIRGERWGVFLLFATTDLTREMYLTARRQTRTEPQMIPESLGLSQYRREFHWAELSHILVSSTKVIFRRV